MKVVALRTPRIVDGQISIYELLDNCIDELHDYSVLVITSKIVSICEGRVVPLKVTDKEKLIASEADKYMPASLSKYGHHFTITNNTLIPMAGIDESNANDNYVLWPYDAQTTANKIREHLCKRFSIKHVGVLITDSTCQPLRRGTTGIALAHSGFRALNDYVGKDDLFGRPMRVTQSNISGGLAAAAVVIMGEGAECTPLAIISDIDAVTFQPRNPTKKELAELSISLEDDLFAPFLKSVPWKTSKRI